MITNGQHFVQEGFVSRAKFLPDDVYAQVLDSIVTACADAVLMNSKGEMLIGKRAVEPHPDWWIIGGRMRPGESFEHAAARNIKRELGVDIEPSRFKYLCTYSLVWARRAQPPHENGSHTVSITMLVRVTDEEVGLIKHNEEYETLKWVYPTEFIFDDTFHPALGMVAKNVTAYIAMPQRDEAR